MKTKKEIGSYGEDYAVKWLAERGYQILERNWRFSRAEIDIIAVKDRALIFVEVKTRSYDYFGQPAEFLTRRQEALIMDAATQYMIAVQHEWEIRFDIISILLGSDNQLEIKHFEDAFGHRI